MWLQNLKIHHHSFEDLVGWGSDNESTDEELLQGFFRFYTEKFNLFRDLVCVQLGKQAIGQSGRRDRKEFFCVMDPFDSRDNCARSVRDRSMAEVIVMEMERAKSVSDYFLWNRGVT